MGTVGNSYMTLLDIEKLKDPDGGITKVIEMMTKANPLLQDIPWKEGNLDTGHQFTARTALPAPAWRKYNEGVTPTKSAGDQYVETCGMLANRSQVDVALANRGGNAAAVRASEDKPFMEGLSQEFALALFYESVATNPERIHGLAARFNSTSGVAGAQIIKADSSASGNDQTSIWLIGYREDSVFGIHPKGTQAGMQMTDLGVQLVSDSGGTKKFKAYVTDWDWNVGLCVQDYRYVARVCNIDTSAWKADLSAGADLVLSLEDAISAIFNTDSCNLMLYMNRSTIGMLQKQLYKRQGNLLEWMTTQNGRRMRHYQGIPIHVSDAITSTESVVS